MNLTTKIPDREYLGKMAHLFRPEVVAARRNRVEGELLVAQSVHVRIAVLVLTIAFITLASYLIFSKFPTVETARGFIEPRGGIVSILPRHSDGILSETLVDVGDLVEKGDILAYISVDKTLSDGTQVGRQATENVQKIQQRERHNFAHERRSRQSTLAQIADQKKFTEEEIEIVRAQRKNMDEVIARSEKTIDELRPLFEAGSIRRLEQETRLVDLLDRKRQRLALDAELLRLHRELGNLATEKEQAQSQLAILQSQQDVSEWDHEMRLAGIIEETSFALVAPVTGHVLAIHIGPGQFVAAGRPIMEIVPQGSTLIANLLVSGSSVGMIDSGMKVIFKFDAFPFRKFGTLTGKISNISRAAFSDKQMSIPISFSGPFFMARVELETAAFSYSGDQYLLKPGMEFTAEIITERTSVFQKIVNLIHNEF